jgi:hypothetical protein
MSPGQYYHLYNYSNGFENLFNESKNYVFFLNKLVEYIDPVCRIFSFSLMPNHYRIVLQVRSEEELWEYFIKSEDLGEKEELRYSENFLEKKVSKFFSNMFNCYAQSYNKWNLRLGSLFMQNMRKEIIRSEDEFRDMIYSIHMSPIELGLVRRVEDWPYSSYQSLISDTWTHLDRDFVLDIFGGLDLFIGFINIPSALN